MWIPSKLKTDNPWGPNLSLMYFITFLFVWHHYPNLQWTSKAWWHIYWPYILRYTVTRDNGFRIVTHEWWTNNIPLLDRWRHLGSGGLRDQEVSVVCLHNNAIVARCILDINIALWDIQTASAPSILLVVLEPHCLIVLSKRHNDRLSWLWQPVVNCMT